MKVGVPKEVKNHEYRVAITPVGVHELEPGPRADDGDRCEQEAHDHEGDGRDGTAATATRAR